MWDPRLQEAQQPLEREALTRWKTKRRRFRQHLGSTEEARTGQMPQPGAQWPLFSHPSLLSPYSCPCPSCAPRVHTLLVSTGDSALSPHLCTCCSLQLLTLTITICVSLVCAESSLLHTISLVLHNHNVKGIIPAFQMQNVRIWELGERAQMYS